MMSRFFSAFHRIVESNINLVLFGSMGVGLVMPWLDRTPNWVVMALLSANMFFSCAKITVEDVKGVRLSTAGWFLVVRYLIMPAAVFWILQPIDFFVATAGLLIVFAPSGVSAPAITGLVKGNIAFSILITVVSHLAFLLVAPFYLHALVGRHISIDIFSLFINLVMMVVAPVLSFSLVRWQNPGLAVGAKMSATTASVLLIGLIIAILVAQLRHSIFADPQFVIYGFFWTSLLYATNYLVGGWALGWKQLSEIRTAMTSVSGANNIALVLVIAVLYMPKEVQLLMVVAEIVWVVSIPVFRSLIAWHEKSDAHRNRTAY